MSGLKDRAQQARLDYMRTELMDQSERLRAVEDSLRATSRRLDALEAELRARLGGSVDTATSCG